MKWKKFTINTTTEAEDIISVMLNELGVEGVQIEDNIPLTEEETKGMFIDILPELPPDDGTSKLSFFLHLPEDGTGTAAEASAVSAAAGKAETVPSEAEAENENTASGEERAQESNGADNADNADSSTVDDSYTVNDRIWTEAEIAELLDNIRSELEAMRAYANIGEGTITEGETSDTDWMNNWKQYFKPFTVGDILIKPSWEEIPEEYADAVENDEITVVSIDPGTAFGTGSHETTKLCINTIRKYIMGGEHVLDIGTGSGILGITALKSGARSVVATDLDDACVDAVNGNVALNDIFEEDFELIIGNIIDDDEVIEAVGEAKYDVVIANILAPVIVTLIDKKVAARHIKPGGLFITSGIIDTKEADVVAAFERDKDWEIVEIDHMGEWVSVTAFRK